MSFKTLRQVTNYKPVSKLGMEELAQRQTEIEPSGGILFARNADGEQKTAARQLVLDLFAGDKWPGPLNMMTLPGLHWRFERKLLGMREIGWMQRRKPRRTHFTGVENDRAIFFGAATQIPGLTTPDALIWPVNRDRFPFAENAIKTRYASFFFANVDDMLAHDWKPAAYREAHMVGWDAAWLDYTGPMSVERLRAVAKFYERFVRSTLIVTVLKARWNRDAVGAIDRAGGHSAWLRKHLPGEVLHDIEYTDTSPMAQFAVRRS
jgi:hypothetical protein